MNRFWITMLAGLFLFACNSQTKTDQQEQTDTASKQAEWIEVVIDVEGMTCDGCENAIKAGVETLEGIASVESSWEEGWTKVKYDRSQTSVDDVSGKITETGYTVKKIEAKLQ